MQSDQDVYSSDEDNFDDESNRFDDENESLIIYDLIFESLEENVVFSESGREFTTDPPFYYQENQSLPKFDQHVGPINIPNNVK